MTIQKSRGYSFEKLTCKYFEKHYDGHSIRLGQPHQPDVLHMSGTIMHVIECKSTISKIIYVDKAQIATLFKWGAKFYAYDSIQVLALRFYTSPKVSKTYYFNVDMIGDYKCTHTGKLYYKRDGKWVRYVQD